MIRLTKTQILILHKNLIQQFGGVDGIRDKNLFDSVVETPFQTFDNQDLVEQL